LLWSHCKTNNIIEKNYKLSDILFVRDEIDKFVENIHNPTVIGFSCFVWNWAFNNEVAKIVKEKYPDCLIIYGGQHQPSVERLKHEQDFFKKNPYVDIIVHGEGELTFEEILLENLKDKNWDSIAGITYQTKDYKFKTTPTRKRIENIDVMPSPYLDGVMDKLVEEWKDKYIFTASVETVRGCPYRCTYCEIGSLYFQKLRPQSFDKMHKEFEWMAKNKVEYIDNADSNFGLYEERDMQIVDLLISLKKKHGFPLIFRNDWAKDKGADLIPIALKLKDADMAKGLTMALQSLNPDTLKAIMRKNIISGNMEEFINKCNDIDLPLYAELIVGLPEETLDSFKSGIYKLIEMGLHNYSGIYPLSILPNTPFGDPTYIEKYKIKYTKTKALYYHITESEIDESEEENIVIETSTMTFEDILKAHEFKWFMMINHFFGLTQFVARFLKNHSDIEYEDFYEKLQEYFSNKPNTVLGNEIKELRVALKEVFTDNRYWGWYLEDKRTWEFDEGSVVKIWKKIDLFYQEIKSFIIKSDLIKNVDVLDAVIDFQKNALLNPNLTYPYKFKLQYNIGDVIENNQPLYNGGYELTINSKTNKDYNGDYINWATEVLWWGRKEGRYKSIVEN
jgi:putative methyltransferase